MDMRSNQPKATSKQVVKEKDIHTERSGSAKYKSCPIFCLILKLNLVRTLQPPLFGCMGLVPTEMILLLLCHSSN
jgi:hypothetical protein